MPASFSNLNAIEFPAKVAHLVISLNNGGLENLVCLWANERNNKHPRSTFVICLDEFGELSSRINADSLFCADAKRSKFPYDRAAVNRMQNFLQKNGIQLIHSHNLTAHQYGVLCSKKANTKHIQTLHGFNLHGDNWKNRLRGSMLSKLTPMHTAVSQNVATWAQKNYRIPDKKIEVIQNSVQAHNPTDPEELRGIRSALNIDETSLILGSTGRLAHVKGWDLFFPVFKKLISNFPDTRIHLVLVGDGSEKTRLESLADELGIADQVHLAGFQQNCTPYYDLFDLFIMPSRSEGLSVALLEAMAAGCPCIVTTVGEHTRIIQESMGGDLLEPDKTTHWENTIAPFIKYSEKRSAAGMHAQQYVSKHYMLEQTMQAYEGLYNQLVSA